MKRTISLMLVLLVVACSGPEPGVNPQAAEPLQVYQWRMVTTWPKNLPGLGTAPERMAENIRTMSQGRLNIKVYGAGEVVPALEVFEAVSQGTVQMGHGAAYCSILYRCSLWTDGAGNEWLVVAWWWHGVMAGTLCAL